MKSRSLLLGAGALLLLAVGSWPPAAIASWETAESGRRPAARGQRPAAAESSAVAAPDPIEPARRIVATLQLAAQEYKLAFQGRELVNAAEWDEARLFLGAARRSARDLAPDLAAELDRTLARLEVRVAARMPPDSLRIVAREVEQRLSRALGVSLDEGPTHRLSLAAGARVWRARCASCHGQGGRGDGPAGTGLTPPPANLTDAALLAAATPLAFYRKVTHGVPGTAMPAFERALTHEERWDAVAFAFALSDSLARQGGSGLLAVAFGAVRGTLGSALALVHAGDREAAASTALDAYMAFEIVEASLGATDPLIVTRAEERFAVMRQAAASGDSAAATRAHAAVLAVVQEAESALVAGRSRLGLFAESLLLILREGFEAILVIGAIMAVLARAGATQRRRTVRLGIVAALVASLLTAALIEWIFRIGPAQQEALEGGVMLLAAATLFYVSYWLISKVEIAAWTRFVKGKIQRAVESGSALALAGVAFLAVYREGFETVLFYKALYMTGGGGGGGAAAVTAGLLAGLAALLGVYVGIERFGLKVPMRPFFAVTGATLSYLSFVFAGQGVRELQHGGYVAVTPIPGAPHSAFFGVYPTVETLMVQAVIVLALLVALAWTFLVRPRRIAAMPAPPAPEAPEAPADAPKRETAGV